MYTVYPKVRECLLNIYFVKQFTAMKIVKLKLNDNSLRIDILIGAFSEHLINLQFFVYESQ